MTMTSVGKIYTYPENVNTYKAQIAAQYVGVNVEIASDFKFGETNKSPEFLKKFPLGKVPAMETADGPLCESEAMLTYVASSVSNNSSLLGGNSYQRALIQKYVLFGANEIATPLGRWFFPMLGYGTYLKPVEDLSKQQLQRALMALDSELVTKTFLVGERVTIADISLACNLYWGYTKLFDITFRSICPNVTRWFLTCVNQPQFKAVLGEVSLCETAMVYDAKKFGKAEEKPKAEKPKAEKKEEKKPKKKDDDDEEPEPEFKEEKKKSALDSLPPSTFILDEWKRFYSNNEPPQAIEFFWQKYDPSGWSLWKVDYKYNDELGAIFMTSNLVGGFFQRLEEARKYAFGSVVITGEDKNNKISGIFLIRGPVIPEEVSGCPDFESYQFSKLDHQNADHKQLINDYLAWEGQSLPGAVKDGKIFK